MATMTATAVALSAVACSGNDSGAPPAVTASSTTSVATTSTSTAPPTATTAAGGATSQTIQTSLRDDYGITFTPQQGACLGDGLVGHPDWIHALDRGYSPPLDVANAVLGLYVRCFGDMPATAHAVVETVVHLGSATPGQGACLEALFRSLSQDDLAQILASGESPAKTRYEGQMLQCVTGADVAT